MQLYEGGALVAFAFLGDELFTAGAASAGLASIPSIGNVRRVLLQPKGGNIIIRAANAPSATRGFKVSDGTVWAWEADPATLRIIRDGGSDVPVEVAYFGV